MNPIITFPPAEPTLKLPRASAEKWAETLAEERRRLQEDQEALREREQNLREYESRLRSLQAEIEASRSGPTQAHAAGAHTTSGATQGTTPTSLRVPSRTPFHHDDPALQAAWEKLHRAREILEAEQNHMRDERISLREQQSQVKQREHAVAEREARLAEREALVTAALPPQEELVDGEPAMSAVTRFTMAPFNMARSVFGAKKEK
jgi:peptidoglycan hydrolase CwlO-like protein